MLGCLETKKEVTCALLSHTLLLLPHNAGRNVQPVHRTKLKLHDSGLYCWMQNKTVHFYWISGHQLERKKARAQMIWFVSSHFIISFQFINHRTKFSLCTQKTRQKLQWKIVVSTPAVKRIQTDIYRNTAECAKRPCVEKRPTRTIHIIRTWFTTHLMSSLWQHTSVCHDMFVREKVEIENVWNQQKNVCCPKLDKEKWWSWFLYCVRQW